MILIQDKVVSLDVLTEEFVCKISSCKGACCREGDFGAPLNDQEIKDLDLYGEKLLPYLNPETQQLIKDEGFYQYYDEMREYGTTLRKDAACAFLSTRFDGIESCGIDKAYKNGDIPMQKPISCALYPIRVEKDEKLGFTALNYDRWSICSAACSHGKELSTPLYQFLEKPIKRAFGTEFYDELHDIASQVDDIP